MYARIKTKNQINIIKDEGRERDLELQYSKSLPVEEKMIRATSASQRTESSSAFLKSPLRRLENVTCLAVALSIFLIWIFSLAIFFTQVINDKELNNEEKISFFWIFLLVLTQGTNQHIKRRNGLLTKSERGTCGGWHWRHFTKFREESERNPS